MIEKMLYLVFIDVVNGSSPIILEVITRRKTNDVIENENLLKYLLVVL